MSEKEAVQHVDNAPPGDVKDDVKDEDFTWTEAEETRVRHKIDWNTVPLVTVLYMFCPPTGRNQFLDRINIGNAFIQGLIADLELGVGKRVNWALCIFYIVYLSVEVPSNIILKRIGPRFYIPLLVVGFGFVTVCMAFVKSYSTLLVSRAFLGAFEGGAFPGIAFFLSCFYKRRELLFRIGVYVSAASFAGAFGGFLATGLSRIPEWGIDSMRIHTWRNIFFFEGIITMILGLLAPIWMPHSPGTAQFLTPREQRIAVVRLAREHAADPDEHVEPKHVKRALLCIHNYTCAFGFFLINVTVQGLSLFMPTILNQFDWSTTKSQLLTVPPYVAACLVAIAVAFASDKTHQRGAWLAGFSILGIIGFSIIRFAEDPNIRYMALFFITVAAFPGGPGFLAWAMNNSAGPAVRAVTSGYVVTLGTIGGIVATWSYMEEDKPEYEIGHTINLVGQFGVLFLSLFGIAYCVMENRKRAAGKRDYRLEGLSEEEAVHLGYRHPDFRYII
ncbi:hypothetical protein MKZ38_009999 [Zalerion maritima]|uniref:Major facilitator superfamily (MFS) profile domain-containing protein n=1 Tax=Zalerion maritima TaxID=339359 RepID=A0AAD5RGH9_9PEZI|nr:hypothetical protein MKZ38_009999 [Zalerion maritima]